MAVTITKKMKFSKVLGVEQNLNKTRFFNSVHIYGPGICIFGCFIMMVNMTYNRLYPKVIQDDKVVSLSHDSFTLNLHINSIFLGLCGEKTVFFTVCSGCIRNSSLSYKLSSQGFYKEKVDNEMFQEKQ